MGIVTAGNPSHMRRWIGCIVVAASALTGCAGHSGPRPMVAQAPSTQIGTSPDPTAPSVTETPTTTQPQTAPTTSTTSGEVTPSDAHATTLPSRVETSNGSEMLPPRGQLIQVEGSRGALDFSANATYLYGSVRGFTQVSAGGKLGTSYFERPHLQSLGITTANIADAEVSADAHQYGQFFVGAQIIQLSGSAVTGGLPVTTDGISYQAHSAHQLRCRAGLVPHRLSLHDPDRHGPKWRGGHHLHALCRSPHLGL